MVKKLISLLLAFCTVLCLASGALTEAEAAGKELSFQSGEWEDKTSGTYSGSTDISFKYGGSYSGKLSDGLPSGKGTYTYYDGTEQTGTFSWKEKVDYVLEKSTKKNGPFYEGTSLHYTGMMLDDKPNGFGELDFQDGGTFYGEFENGTVHGKGIYVYREPEGKDYVSGSDWKLVSRISSSLGGRWYSGLTLYGDWEGFGMLCYDYSYYIGEVYQQYCNGHGAYWKWTQKGDPSGTMNISKEGHYESGSLQYSCRHSRKFSNVLFETKIASSDSVSDSKTTSSTQKSSTSSSFNYGTFDSSTQKTTTKSCGSCGGTKRCQICSNGYNPCSGSSCNRGRCGVCGGSGKVYSLDRSTKKDCIYCIAGKCSICGGSGKIKCSICRGSGVCQTCKNR